MYALSLSQSLYAGPICGMIVHRLPPPPSYGTMPLGRVYRSTTRGVASVWNGELSPRVYLNSTFSCKIFLGGVPRDVTEPTLVETFRKYGSCRVEWPVKETSSSLHANTKSNQHAKVSGYVYMIFESESSVKKVMSDCSQEFGFAGDCYFKMKLRRGQTNEIRQTVTPYCCEIVQVQVVPWLISDAEYVARPGVRIDPKKTVFVGALHGMLTAQGLHSVMSEVFGDVVCVSIDTDRYRYPIGRC
ncbi:unnamed protein product [Toxocara canis]|uniref:RRM domain-containing protein n=1 Tax=Toxocara canis TaxID=6265 RepID=A0A183VF90_TOXCA|nr:unnamed protein product [Toxocara canis]